MRVRIDYGIKGLDIDISDGNLAGILHQRKMTPLRDPEEAVEKALKEPTGSQPLGEIASGKGTICIVVSDITRPVPNKILLPPILRCIEEQGLRADDISILVATGLHRPCTEEELAQILGEDLVRRYRIINHRGRDLSTHRYLGETGRGTPVYIDERYLGAEVKILTGLIEPHFMAGYSGGMKSVCPGLAHMDTVRAIHGPHLLEDERASSGVIEGNPVHEEIMAATEMAGVDFIVNAVIDENRKPIGIFAGDLVEAFNQGTRFAEELVTSYIPEPVDVVVTSSAGYPLDATFYQSVKGMVAPLPVLKDGGTIIIAAECSEGIGGQEYTELMLETDNIEDFMEKIWSPSYFVVDQWQFEEHVKALRRAEILMYSGGIPRGVLERLFVTPISSVEEGVKIALSRHGKDAKIIIMPKGPYVIPRIG